MKRLLGLLCLALVVVIVWQWGTWPPPRRGLPPNITAESVEPPVANQPSETRVSQASPLNKDDYVSVIDRPLFLSSRRPPEEQGPAESAVPEELTPEVPLDNFDLNAVIITPAGAIAWVTTPSEPKPQKVQIGDELEGWKIKNISNDEIEVEGQSGSDRLVLRNFSQSGQPVTKSPPRTERKNRPTPPSSRSPVTSRQREQKPPPAPPSKTKNPSRPGANPTRNGQ